VPKGFASTCDSVSHGAGVLAGSGQLSLGIALCLAVIACLLADLLWYEAGRRWGNKILHFIYGLASDPHTAIRRAKRNFHRHGSRTLILAKFVMAISLLPGDIGLGNSSSPVER